MSGGWAGPPSPAPQWVQRGAAPGRGGRSLPAELRLGGGGGGLSAREGKGRRSASPTHRAAPAAAAPAEQAATWLCCGFSPSQLLIFRGPLLYFNACFYGNIYGAHAPYKTPSYSRSAAMLLEEMMLLVLEFHGLPPAVMRTGWAGHGRRPGSLPSVCTQNRGGTSASLPASGDRGSANAPPGPLGTF